jgi:hypothetical protein
MQTRHSDEGRKRWNGNGRNSIVASRSRLGAVVSGAGLLLGRVP